MSAKFILKDTAAGKELVLPVTPSGYSIEHGRKINTITMQQMGDINLPGPFSLFDEPLDCLLPAHDYPFNQPGASTNPFTYLEQLEKWSDSGAILRFIVSDTPVNAAVLLGPIRYEERDGTGDLYCTIPLRRYRALSAGTQNPQTGNAARAVETPPEKASAYTVKAGDTLYALCRKFYGDPSLYGKLAEANGVKNPNLILVGQALKLPEKL